MRLRSGKSLVREGNVVPRVCERLPAITPKRKAVGILAAFFFPASRVGMHSAAGLNAARRAEVIASFRG